MEYCILRRLNHLHCKWQRKNLTGEISAYNEDPDPESTAWKDVILCLYKGDNCISSITFKPSKDSSVTIDSRTHDYEVGKKYNTFLRMCAILLVNDWDIKTIKSNAESPITVWVFSKYFRDHIEFDNDFKDFLKDCDPNNEETIFKIKESSKNRIESIKQICAVLKESRNKIMENKDRFIKLIKEHFKKQIFINITLNINEYVLKIANEQINILLNSETGITCK
jgi:hypothetical protein